MMINARDNTEMKNWASAKERLLAMAKEENVSLDDDRINNILRNYKSEEIWRVVDMFERFGMKAILDNMNR